jgi:hypothetical protein
MDITIHPGFLPHTDPDASLASYRDSLGFQVRNDVGYGGLRWNIVGPPDQPGTSIVLEAPFAPGCGVTDEERRIIVEMRPRAPTAGSCWPPPIWTAPSSGCRSAVSRVGRGTLPTPPAPVVGG